jgi:hypothetical protein
VRGEAEPLVIARDGLQNLRTGAAIGARTGTLPRVTFRYQSGRLHCLRTRCEVCLSPITSKLPDHSFATCTFCCVKQACLD